MDKNLRIVYMGTPDFAVPPLQALKEAGYDVVGVITAPDKPAGRGLALQVSPVKAYAVAQGLRVLQPERLKDPVFLEELRSLEADLQVVVAFRMLPEAVWNMPPLGTFNLHASLLPDYRGAAPINRALMNGETETGLTTFFLKHEIDTGDIIFQERMLIRPEEDAGTLHDRMMLAGADLVLRTVQAIAAGTAPRRAQPMGGSSKEAPKIFKQDCKIHWADGYIQVYNHIRGLSPYPAAWTTLQGKTFKIYKARPEAADIDMPPGMVETDGKKYMRVACPAGWLNLLEVQLEGKKRLPIEDFLRGYPMTDGLVLGA